MATIGIRWENADPPADKDDWERIIAGAVADLSVTGTVVRYPMSPIAAGFEGDVGPNEDGLR